MLAKLVFRIELKLSGLACPTEASQNKRCVFNFLVLREFVFATQGVGARYTCSSLASKRTFRAASLSCGRGEGFASAGGIAAGRIRARGRSRPKGVVSKM